MKKTNKSYKSPINWEYCECGCHGSEVSVGGVDFWCRMDWAMLFNGKPNYDKPYMVLRRGHGFCGVDLGTFYKYEDVDAKVLDVLEERNAEKNLKDQLKALRQLKKTFNK